MSNHKNHGSRHVKGFRPGHAPAIVPTQTRVSYTMGFNAEGGIVIIEWSKPIANLNMEPHAIDEMITNLQGAKAALLEAMAKLPPKDQAAPANEG